MVPAGRMFLSLWRQLSCPPPTCGSMTCPCDPADSPWHVSTRQSTSVPSCRPAFSTDFLTRNNFRGNLILNCQTKPSLPSEDHQHGVDLHLPQVVAPLPGVQRTKLLQEAANIMDTCRHFHSALLHYGQTRLICVLSILFSFKNKFYFYKFNKLQKS